MAEEVSPGEETPNAATEVESDTPDQVPETEDE